MKIIKNVATVILILFLVVILTIFIVNKKPDDLKIVDKIQKQRNENDTNSDINEEMSVQIVAEDLEIPWEIAFLPDGTMLATERSGQLIIFSEKNERIEIEGVNHVGEGGLLGLAVHPDFIDNSYIYLYFTTNINDTLENRVVRYLLRNATLTEEKVIFSGIEAAANHNGGRIAFGPDGYLYITTGDAQNDSDAQNTDSLAGKILRLTPDGDIPENNPFGNAVYSYGHRNPQGLTWDDEGRLWATEHGPSGFQSGQDELNLIQIGLNYGWPILRGDETGEGFTLPIIQSGTDTTWAPSGVAFYEGNVYFAGLRGESLYKYNIATGDLVSYLTNTYGRLRAVVLGSDGYLYVTTSNKDGRGTRREGDDKILKINISQLD